MATNIDKNVVEMKFDGTNFANGVKETTGLLDKLRSALKFSGSDDVFSNINKAAGNVNLNGISNAVDNVQGKFSAFEQIAIGALRRIGEQAVVTGTQLVKSLTIDQVTAGFQEYELKMGAIQTIMNSTGADLGIVNSKLYELNDYADQTIYSFRDMTSNVSKFTNAGISLDDSVQAMMGIGNAAALAGANTAEASRAMYNFAQAMSVGHMSLIDWRSIENANMGTVDFKQLLIDVGEEMGTLIKEGETYTTTTTDMNDKIREGITSTIGFRDSLAAQWMTTEVLTEALKRLGDQNTELGKKAFAAAQDIKTGSQLLDTWKESIASGWGETFELIFGDFEEAKKLWTGIDKTVGKAIANVAERRNDMLREWRENGGRENLIGAIKNIGEAVADVFKPLREAFREIFPAMSGERLANITRGFFDFTRSLKVTEEIQRKLKDAFDGLLTPIRLAKDAIKSFIDVFGSDIGGVIRGFAEGILNAASTIGKFVADLGKAIIEAEVFQKAFQGIKDVITGIVDAIKNSDIYQNYIEPLFSKIKDGFSKLGQRMRDGSLVKDIMALPKSIGDAMNGVKSNIEGPLGTIASTLGTIFGKIRDVINGVVDAVKSLFGVKLPDDSLLKQIADSIEKNGKAFEDINSKNFIDKIKEATSAVGDLFKNVFTELGNIFKNFDFGEFIRSIPEKISNAFKTIFSKINIDFDPGSIIDQVKGFFNKIWDAINNWFETSDLGQGISKAGEKIIDTLKNVFNSIKDFVSNFNIDIDFGSIFGAIGDVLNTLGDTLSKAYDKVKGVLKSIIDGIGGFLKSEEFKAILSGFKVGGGLMLGKSLANVFNSLATLLESPAKLIGNLTDIGSAITGTFKSIQTQLKADALLQIAKAIGIFSVSLVALTAVDTGKLVASLAVLSGGLAGMVTAMKFMTKFQTVIGSAKMIGMATALSKVATSLIKFSIALRLVVVSIERLGDMDFGSLVQGLAATLGAMAALVTVAKKLNKMDGQAGFTGILKLGAALWAVTKAVQNFGKMDFGELIQGFAGLAASLLLLTTAANKLPTNEHFTKTGTALLLLAVGLRVVASAVKAFGNMDFGEMVQGLIGVGTAMLMLTKSMKGMPAKQNFVQTGVALVLMAVSLRRVAKAVEQFGSLDLGTLVKGLAGIGGSLFIMTKAMQGLSGFQGSAIKTAAGILVLAHALDDIAAAVEQFGSLSFGELAKGLVGLGGSLLILTKSLKPLSDSQWGAAQAAAGILILAHSLDEIQAAVASFGGMDWESLVKGLVGLSGALLAMRGALSKSGISGIQGGAGSAIGFIGIAASIHILVGAFKELETVSWEAIAKGIVTMITAIAGAKFGGMAKGGIAQLAGIIAEIGAILVAFGALKQIPGLDWIIGEGGDMIETVLQQLEKLSTHIVAIVGIVAGGAATSLIGRPAMAGIGMLAGIIGELGVVFTAFGALKQIPGLDWIVNEGGDAIANVVSQIGKIVGKIQGAYDAAKAEESSKGLEAVGKNFTKFADQIGAIDSGKVESATKVMETITGMMENMPNVPGLWQKVFGGGKMTLDEFGESFDGYGQALGSFVDGISGISTEGLDQAKIVSDFMVSLQDTMPNVPTFFEKIFGGGKMTMNEFGGSFDSYGKALSDFVNSIQGLTTDGLDQAKLVSDFMVATQDTMPNVPTFFEKIFGGGQMTMNEFGSTFSTYGEALTSFIDSIQGLTSENLDQAKLVSDFMVETQGTMPNVPTFFETIFGGGQMSMNDFGSSFSNYGKALTDFINSVSGIDASSIDQAKLVSDFMIATQDSMPNIPSFFDKIFGSGGQATLNEFGGSFSEYGNAISSFVDSIKDISVTDDDISTAQKVSNLLTSLQETMPNIPTTLSKIFGGEYQSSLSEFGSSIEGFGSAITAFTNEVSGITIDDNTVSTVTKVGDLLVEMQNKMPEGAPSILEKIFKGDSQVSLSDFGTSISGFGSAIKSFTDEIKDVDISDDTVATVGKVASMLTDMNNNMPNMPSLIQNVFGGGQMSMDDFGSDLKSFGKALADFSNSLKDVDSANIEKAKTSISALTELAKLLPESNNVIQATVGNKKLSFEEFGKDLVKFSEQLKQYSTNLQDVDMSKNESITKAISSLITATAEVKTVENGQSNLNLIASDLGDLGYGIQQYWNAISNVDTDKITKLTDSLSKMISSLGGTEEGQLSGLKTFSDSLKELGENGISALAEGLGSQENIDEIINSVNTLFETITNSISGGENGESTLVESMKKIGEDAVKAIYDAMSNTESSSESVSGVADNIANGLKDSFTEEMFTPIGESIMDSLVSGLTTATETLNESLSSVSTSILDAIKAGLTAEELSTVGSDILTGISDGFTSSMETFNQTITDLTTGIITTLTDSFSAEELSAVGVSAVTALGDGFTSSEDALNTIIINMSTTIITTLQTNLSMKAFTTVATTAMNGLSNGLSSGAANASSTASIAATSVLNAFKNTLTRKAGVSIGQAIMNGLSNGLSSGAANASSTASIAATSVLNAFKNTLTREAGVSIGQAIMDGIIAGIQSKQSALTTAAKAAAQSAYNAAKTQLGISSPSKKFMYIGDQAINGLVYGLKRGTADVTKAATAIADHAVNPLDLAIDSLFKNIQSLELPELKIGIDTSQLDNTLAGISNRTVSIDISRAAMQAYKINDAMRRNYEYNMARSNQSPIVENNYNFEQSNYSPTALSRTEIYRQSKNLFAQLKGVTGNND